MYSWGFQRYSPLSPLLTPRSGGALFLTHPPPYRGVSRYSTRRRGYLFTPKFRGVS